MFFFSAFSKRQNNCFVLFLFLLCCYSVFKNVIHKLYFQFFIFLCCCCRLVTDSWWCSFIFVVIFFIIFLIILFYFFCYTCWVFWVCMCVFGGEGFEGTRGWFNLIERVVVVYSMRTVFLVFFIQSYFCCCFSLVLLFLLLFVEYCHKSGGKSDLWQFTIFLIVILNICNILIL